MSIHKNDRIRADCRGDFKTRLPQLMMRKPWVQGDKWQCRLKFSDTAWQMRSFFKYHIHVHVVSELVTLIDKAVSQPAKHMLLFAHKGGIIQQIKLLLWIFKDENMASVRWNDACQIVRLHLLSVFPQAICWCGSGCFSLVCLWSTCFYGNPPQHCHKAGSGSVHASLCGSKVFTSISEGVWVIWKGPPPCQSPVEWQSMFVLFAAFCCGVVCVWLKCLRLTYLCRSRGRHHPLLWLSLLTTGSLMFLKRFSQTICWVYSVVTDSEKSKLIH